MNFTQAVLKTWQETWKYTPCICQEHTALHPTPGYASCWWKKHWLCSQWPLSAVPPPERHVSSPTGAPVSLFEAPPRTKAIAVQELRCPLVHGSFKWGITGAVWNQRSLGPANAGPNAPAAVLPRFCASTDRRPSAPTCPAPSVRSGVIRSIRVTNYPRKVHWLCQDLNDHSMQHIWECRFVCLVSLVGQIHNGRKPTESLGIETTVVLYHCNSAQAQAGKRIWKQSRKWK